MWPGSTDSSVQSIDLNRAKDGTRVRPDAKGGDMAKPVWEKLAAATGIGFVILFIVGGWLVGGAGEETDDPARVVADRLLENDVQLGVGTVLLTLAAVALLWFSASLWASLRRAEGDPARVSAIAFGGGAIASASLLVGSLMAGASGFELADFQESAEGARAFYGVSFVYTFFGTAIFLGVLLAATGTVSIRTGFLPSWLGWTGAILGVLFILGWWTFFIPFFGGVLALIWIIVVSGILIRRVGAAPAAGVPPG